MPVIKVKNLSRNFKVHEKEPGFIGSLKSVVRRNYKTVKAVSDISFGIDEGELVGFIGPNGAGKTTTLKCLSGLLYPSKGQVEVLGYDPWERKHQFLKQISLVMGQKNQLWWDLPAMESFILNKEIYEIPDDRFAKMLDELTNLLELKEILSVQVRKLSLGQRMKCELASSLLHSPKVLFLDEPTIGLDVVMQKKIREFIKTYNKKYKASIILTSHYMGDVAELCKRVIIIDKGTIVYDGLLQDIYIRFADHKIIKVVFKNQDFSRHKLNQLKELKDFSYPSAVFSVNRSQVSKTTSILLRDFPIADLNIEEPKIEDIIRELFTGKDYS